MSKITAYASLAPPLSDDVLPIVDVHDTTMAPSGTTKKIAVSDLLGGSLTGSHAWLITALPALAYTAVTRNASEAVTSASVTWPDGTTGTFTADVLSSQFPGAVDAYHVTYSASTVTQAQVTRDSSGAVTAQPALTVT